MKLAYYITSFRISSFFLIHIFKNTIPTARARVSYAITIFVRYNHKIFSMLCFFFLFFFFFFFLTLLSGSCCFYKNNLFFRPKQQCRCSSLAYNLLYYVLHTRVSSVLLLRLCVGGLWVYYKAIHREMSLSLIKTGAPLCAGRRPSYGRGLVPQR